MLIYDTRRIREVLAAWAGMLIMDRPVRREAGASLLEIADKNQVGNGGAGREFQRRVHEALRVRIALAA